MSGRIRTIKPEWLEDERLVLASSDARVLSIALLLLADDYGNGRLVSQVLASRIFPASPGIFANALGELATAKYVQVYQVDGQTYFSIRNWARHQRVDKPGKPRVPAPLGAHVENIIETPGKIRGTLAPDPDPDLDHDREREGRARAGDSLIEHTVSTRDAAELIEHWQRERFKRGQKQTLVTPETWRISAKEIIALADGDLEKAKRVVSAYVGSDHEYWQRKKWALSLLAEAKDFEQAVLLVDSDNKNDPARSRAGFDANKYEANLARQIAEIEAENAAEAGGVS